MGGLEECPVVYTSLYGPSASMDGPMHMITTSDSHQISQQAFSADRIKGWKNH